MSILLSKACDPDEKKRREWEQKSVNRMWVTQIAKRRSGKRKSNMKMCTKQWDIIDLCRQNYTYTYSPTFPEHLQRQVDMSIVKRYFSIAIVKKWVASVEPKQTDLCSNHPLLLHGVSTFCVSILSRSLSTQNDYIKLQALSGF